MQMIINKQKIYAAGNQNIVDLQCNDEFWTTRLISITINAKLL
jgi:hypothetical protein